MKTIRIPKALASFVLTSALVLPTLGHAQTAGQDMHNAGTDTKNASVDTGHAVKHTTKKTYHKSKSGTAKVADKTKEGGTIAVDKTKEGTVKGFDKTKEGTKKLFGAKDTKATEAHDNAKNARMTAKDNANIDKTKVQADAPH